MSVETVLHLGSNVGDRHERLSQAISLIQNYIGHVHKTSSIYETAPWGQVPQGAFLNVAILISTQLSSEDLIKRTQAIEVLLDKNIEQRWGPRTIDIDIVFYGNHIIDLANLTIPHPRLQDRNFVLIPLQEIIPEWEHPIFLKDISTLQKDCTDTAEVSKWSFREI